MPIKDQKNCFRNINGKHYMNYADLIYGEKENLKLEKEAKETYHSVRVIKTKFGYSQLFVECEPIEIISNITHKPCIIYEPKTKI